MTELNIDDPFTIIANSEWEADVWEVGTIDEDTQNEQ